MIPVYLITMAFATIVFLIVTIRDILTKRINSLINYGMIIILAGTYSTLPGDIFINYFELIILYLLVYALNTFYKKSYAQGDLELFYWIVPTVFILGLFSVMVFYFFLSALYLIQGMLMKEWKIKELPGTTHIFGAFLLSLLMGLLWT